MSGKTRASLLSLTIIAVIIFSAFGPTNAYADGGETSETPPTEATAAPEEAPAEETTTEEPSTESTEATPEPAPAEASEAEAAAPAEEPVLTEVPEDTTVTVVDENGESQPLATQEAADAIAESDPIWCPAGASPTPGANGCTSSFNSFDELLTFISGNATYSGAGTIYVEQGTYTGNDPGGVIDFNSPSYDLSNIRNSDLAVTGGWNPGSGVDPASTSDFTNTRIIIGSTASPWGGAVSVNNITMTFTNEGPEIPATPENALTVVSTGNVDLTNVEISNAPSAGAEIDAGGNVSITRSKFHRNRVAGTIVRAGGDVNVLDSEFQNPRITLQRRQIVGLDVNSGGNVSLANVLASGNREEGVDIVAAGAVTIGNSVFNGTMEIEGSRRAPTAFLGFGLRVVTPGEINVDSVTANDNFLWGAWLDGGGPIAVANSIFNANSTETDGFIDDTGIFIYGDNIVSLSSVQANDNRLYGAWIDTAGDVSINLSVFNNNRGVVNLTGANTFHGEGIHVENAANIAISNTDASGNMVFGAWLNAAGAVDVFNSTLNNTTGSGVTTDGTGLQIDSGGGVTIVDVVLNNNQANGASVTAVDSVALDNVTANDNGGDGVAVQASCVFLLGGNYSGNGQFGLNLGSSALSLLAPPTFSGNGAGDISPDNPATCTFATAATGTGAANIFASQSSPTSAEATTAGAESMSLTTFLGAGKSSHGSIFFGKYGYADTVAGIEVFALVPSFDVLAKE